MHTNGMRFAIDDPFWQGWLGTMYRDEVKQRLYAARRERVIAERARRMERAALVRIADEAAPAAPSHQRKRL